jgi:hypothetical protein
MKQKSISLNKELGHVLKDYLSCRYDKTISEFIREQEELLFYQIKNRKFLLNDWWLKTLNEMTEDRQKSEFKENDMDTKLLLSFLEFRKNKRLRLKFVKNKKEEYTRFVIMLNPDHDKVFLEKSRELNFAGYDYLTFKIILFLNYELLCIDLPRGTYDEIIKSVKKYTFKLKEIKRNENLHYNYLLEIEDDFKRKEDSKTNPFSMEEYKIKFGGDKK